MATIKIEGVPPFDGDYPFDAGSFTGRELHTIKQISGVRAGELRDALTAGDYDLVVAFTVIVLRRAGRTVEPEQILDASIGAITVNLDSDTVEVEARPPASPPPSGDGSLSGEPNAHDGRTPASGSASRDIGENPASAPSPTGVLGLATPVDSDPETLAS